MINDAEVLELCNCWIEFHFWDVFQVYPTPNRIRLLDCIVHIRGVVKKSNGYHMVRLTIRVGVSPLGPDCKQM